MKDWTCDANSRVSAGPVRNANQTGMPPHQDLRRGDESQELVGTGRTRVERMGGISAGVGGGGGSARLYWVPFLESVGRGKECAGDLTYYTWHSICGILHSTMDWFDVRLYSLYYRIDTPTFHTVQIIFYIPGSSLHTWHSTGTGNNGIF